MLRQATHNSTRRAKTKPTEGLLRYTFLTTMSKKDNSGSAEILGYLNEKNRPFSAQDVFTNLQKKCGLGKTAVVKAMEQLAQEGKIREKIYGKQKIYFADQSQFGDVSDAELRNMDARIAEISGEVQSTSQTCRQMDADLKELNNSLTTDDMKTQIQKLQTECSEYRERLEKIKTATNHVTPEEKQKVYTERDTYVKEWKKRKRLVSDMIGAILEGYPKSKKQFLEEAGVETDEDHKVAIPNI